MVGPRVSAQDREERRLRRVVRRERGEAVPREGQEDRRGGHQVRKSPRVPLGDGSSWG